MSIDWSLISPALQNVIEVIVIGLAGTLWRFLYQKTKIGQYMHKSTVMNEVVSNMIRFAEQTCGDLKNSSKFTIVMEESRKQLQTHGISVTDDELQKFIEATLKDIKDKVGQQWSESGSGTGQ